MCDGFAAYVKVVMIVVTEFIGLTQQMKGVDYEFKPIAVQLICRPVKFDITLLRPDVTTICTFLRTYTHK
jgi:hypothetical protein